MNDSPDQEHLTTAARTLMTHRRQRATARRRVRAVLDAMAAEARLYLGAAFTENDPVTNLAVALVVRSDERLPDDYETQTPRPPTDTVSRLIIDVLGRALTIEITDGGSVSASGDTRSVSLDGISDVRVSGGGSPAPTYLVVAGDDPNKRLDIPFVRVLADLIDTAAQDETRFAAAHVAAQPQPRTAASDMDDSDVAS